MTDMKELFEMATKQMEPDQDSWREQQRKQARSSRNRKVGALVAVAAMVIVAAVVAVSVRSGAGPDPSILDPPVVPVDDGYYLVGLGGGSPIEIPGPNGSTWYRPSPDGARIAFVNADADGVDQIFEMAPDGSDVTQRTFGRRDALEPAWSPDGHRIVFSGVSADGGREIFILEPSGRTSQLTDLRSLEEGWQPTWSPDGSTIAFVIADPHTVTISTVDVESRRIERGVIPGAFSPGVVSPGRPVRLHERHGRNDRGGRPRGRLRRARDHEPDQQLALLVTRRNADRIRHGDPRRSGPLPAGRRDRRHASGLLGVLHGGVVRRRDAARDDGLLLLARQSGRRACERGPGTTVAGSSAGSLRRWGGRRSKV